MRELANHSRTFTEGHSEATKQFAWAAPAQFTLDEVERVSTRSYDMEHPCIPTLAVAVVRWSGSGRLRMCSGASATSNLLDVSDRDRTS